ncbi:MAG: LysM peptidoglycan-binding domain-containing protein [Bacteroidota bacterium]
MTIVLHYTVRSGDTFDAIAQGLNHAAGVSYEAIEATNPSIPASKLQPGNVLKIPSATASSEIVLHYTVRIGDSYFKIAENLSKCKGMTANELENANPSTNPNDLQIGEVLQVPNTSGVSTNCQSIPADYVCNWIWNYSPDSYSPPLPNATMGMAFSGYAAVTTALSLGNSIINHLQGEKYLTIGGGNDKGAFTSNVLTTLNKAIEAGEFKNFNGVAYDVEMGDSGLEEDFGTSFATAKNAGLKVLVTVSHSAPFGIDDAATLMKSFFASEYIDFLSPQLYTSGNETQNNYQISHGVEWSEYASAKATVIASIVTANLYPSAQSYFKERGVDLPGFIQWQQCQATLDNA